MVGVGRSREIRFMAGVARRRRGIVVVVRMALRTSNRGVSTCQWIVRVQSVIEFCVEPISRRMARSAVMGQTELHMRRIIAVHKIACVARIAVGWRSRKNVVDVARRAGQSGVRSGQRVASGLQMVKLCVEPTVHCVATLTRRRKPCRNVVENRSQKVLLMAGVACRRETRVLARSRILVTVLALQQSMRTHQRKAILVIADFL